MSTARTALVSNPSVRFQKLTAGIDGIRNQFLMSHRTGDKAHVKKLDKWLAEAEQDVAALLADLKPLLTSVRAAAKPDADIARSLATAIENLAKATGAGLWRIDTLHSQVVLHAAEADRDYWLRMPELRVSGLLRNIPELVALLKSRGILTWWHEPDSRHRIVDVNWLTAHGDIRAFVVGEALRGRRCRFCRVEESPVYAGLIAVNPEERHGLVIDEASRAVQLRLGVVYVHRECLEPWLKWVSIAQRYATQQEAEEADRAAGRVARGLPPAPVTELEPKPGEAPEGYRYGRDPDYGVDPNSRRREPEPETHTAPFRGDNAATLAAKIRRARGER